VTSPIETDQDALWENLHDATGLDETPVERLVIPIGKSEPVSIVRGEPPDLSSILVSPSEALC